MLPRTHGEAFNFLRYEIGQKYDSHYDAFNPTNMANRKAKGLLPCCICLMLKKVEKPCSLIENGAEMGMSYDYKKCIGLKIMPKQGDGLLFYSVFPNGTIDPTSLPGSCPVSKG